MSLRRMASVVVLLLATVAGRADEPPKMKFNEVKEIAPGVFFRYSSISATDPKIPFGGSNNIWVVFNDYVVVYDANFPKEAGDVLEAIRKTTDKPIRYVLDSHHHGDHAYGNEVFGKAGASIVAQANCARLLRTTGPEEFRKAGEGPTGRKDIAASRLRPADVIFDDKMVLDDGTQRVEFLHFGHMHTPGDAVMYLPKHKILCTGDSCGNGAFNYTGHGDTASWIRCLEKAQQLDVKMICPGHGEIGGKDLLGKQRRYFVELRQAVQKGIDAGKSFDDIVKDVDLPWYKEWTGVEAKSRKENLEHVYGELTGRVMPADLVENFAIYEGPSPTRETPGWKAPKRIVVPNLMPARLAELKRLAPDVEFVPVKTPEDAGRVAGEADAVLGFATPEIFKAGERLRWVQTGDADDASGLAKRAGKGVAVTDLRHAGSVAAAEQAMAVLLALTNGTATAAPGELRGKTLLVVGLGGTGELVARRAAAFGMRVRAVDAQRTERPDHVFSLDGLPKLSELLPEVDVVVLAVPLTEETRGLIGAPQLRAMKKAAYLVNAGRAELVDSLAVENAVRAGYLLGAGLRRDQRDPAPRGGNPRWRDLNVIEWYTDDSGASPEAVERRWRLLRENVRRFVAGERLLFVVAN
jgi:cyclase